MQNSFKSKIKYFVWESVRPRSKQEYAEIFRRGLGAESKDNGLLKPVSSRPCVPWLWLRVLALLFVLFSLTVLAYRLCVGATDLMAAVVVGGLAFNAATLTFFYELYPEKNLNLPLVFIVSLVCGAAACSLSSFGYEYIYRDPNMSNPWVSLIWTAFWEETVKFAVALPALYMLVKSKNPYACFLIGFAAGTGYSLFEDFGYIYSYSRGYNYEWLTLMTVGRGLSCAFSHAPWTALICWAFGYFKKPFLNFRFYCAVLSSMVLHYLADVPFFVEELAFLTGLNWGWLIEAVVVAAIVTAQYFAIKLSFKSVSAVNTEMPPKPTVPQAAGIAARRKRLSHAANLTAVCGAVFAAMLVLTGCTLDIGYKTAYNEFADDKSFISYMQKGLTLRTEWEREYGEENYSEHYENGVLTRAVQKETSDGYDYYYYYSLKGEKPVLNHIGVAVEGVVYYCRTFTVSNGVVYMDYGYPNYDDGITLPKDENAEEDKPQTVALPPHGADTEIDLSYYALVDDRPVYDSKTGKIKYECGTEFVGAAYAIALGALFAATAAGCVTAVIILKIKSGRYSDD